jgi:hypothetical protein
MKRLSSGDRCDERCLVECKEQILVRNRDTERERERGGEEKRLTDVTERRYSV